jgi:hypothetical protein
MKGENIMKRILQLVSLAVLWTLIASAQELRVRYDATPLSFPHSPDWGNDVLISPSEPLGRPSGVARPNGTVFVAVPDTNLIPGFAIRVFESTDFGDTWTMRSGGITPAVPVSRIKMIRSGADSIYCVFQLGTSIFCWNIESGNLNLFSGEAARDFDIVTGASTGDLFIFVDVASNNQIRRYGSVDGGATWGSAATVTSGGAHPFVYMSGTDTLVLNYYGPVLADTTMSVIRAARYRRTGSGTLASINFQDVATDPVHKNQFASVIHASRVWFFYTSGDSGAIDIKCRVSTDNGTTYGTAFDVAANPVTSEYWFDAKHWSGGVDLVYVADTVGSGDGLMYTSASLTTPSTFITPEMISEHAPSYSAAWYTPTTIEFFDTGDDVGAIWVGQNAASPGLYWDRLGAPPVGVTEYKVGIPRVFQLSHNFPNPFNPTTTIRFDLPEQSHVVLRVYNVLGQEVTTLVNGDRPAGFFSVTWNGANSLGASASSGVYFYRIDAVPVDGGETFSQIEKMTLLK